MGDIEFYLLYRETCTENPGCLVFMGRGGRYFAFDSGVDRVRVVLGDEVSYGTILGKGRQIPYVSLTEKAMSLIVDHFEECGCSVVIRETVSP